MTPVIIQAVRERENFVGDLTTVLPHAQVVWDEKTYQTGLGVLPNGGSPIRTFLRALRMAGEGPAIYLEDDAELCGSFEEYADLEIRERPNSVIQFFWPAARKFKGKDRMDLNSRSHWDTRPWSANICFYLPARVSACVLEFAPSWMAKTKKAAKWDSYEGHHGMDQDTLVADWLIAFRLRYWICYPSLADHRVSVSTINPHRPNTRRAVRFIG